jgi:hypothetical protein
MDNNGTNERSEQRRSGGAFFRHMLRKVKPEHVAEMIDMLRRMQHPDKPIMVPRKGPWAMKMPEGYLLLGEGPVGLDLEPPPAQPATRGDGNVPRASMLDERDTEAILGLAKQALGMKRPEQDMILARIYALDFDLCDQEAIEAIDELT